VDGATNNVKHNAKHDAKHIFKHAMLAPIGNFLIRLIIGFFHVEMRKV
tara:strand:+ start:3315 stop:3458 length:144 start_codon:yes stop_codon:yes gene_type:complete